MGRPARNITILILAGGSALGGVSAVLAQGDGSATDNPDLLRGSLGVGCPSGTLCDFPAADLTAPAALAPLPLVTATPISAQTPEPVPASTPIPQPAYIPVEHANLGEFGYGITLRGAYVRSGEDEDFEMLAEPELSFSRAGTATDAALSASATLVRPDSDDPRIEEANVSTEIAHRLSPSSGLRFDAGVGLSREDAIDAPTEVVASLETAYRQTFGRLDATGSVGVTREWSEVERSIRYEGGMRFGYELSPVIEAFGEASTGRTQFDAIDPLIGARRDSTDYQLRGGFVADWNDVMTLEASVGQGWRTFDAAGLSDARTWLYGAAIGYRPSAVTQLVASLDTELTPGEGASGASTAYRAGLEVSHTANSWLGLRASAGLEWIAPEDGMPASRLYTAGVGADIAIGPHTSAVLDYEYGLREEPGSAEPNREEHRVSGGISLQY